MASVGCFGRLVAAGVRLVHALVMALFVALFVGFAAFHGAVAVPAAFRALPAPLALAVAALSVYVAASIAVNYARAVAASPPPLPDASRLADFFDGPPADAPFLVCRHCGTLKPLRCHHCRTCGRCVARMDHHCGRPAAA